MTTLTKKRRKQAKKKAKHPNGFTGGSDKMIIASDIKTKEIEAIEEVFPEDINTNI
jgi:hypothetical protein